MIPKKEQKLKIKQQKKKVVIFKWNIADYW